MTRRPVDRCGACGGVIVLVLDPTVHVFGQPNWRHRDVERCPGRKR